jgi:hypothetical protein
MAGRDVLTCHSISVSARKLCAVYLLGYILNTILADMAYPLHPLFPQWDQVLRNLVCKADLAMVKCKLPHLVAAADTLACTPLSLP